ncbi:MAG: ParB/RepB/Spo0J family partition protein [Steroidobacteraceae bacterium]
MPSITMMNPFRCRMWEFHDRLEAHISETTCRAEIASFGAHGQFVPALGRSLKGNADHDVELITGARRLFVARHLNKPLAVELRTWPDKEALIAMDAENRLRKDISPYERAVSYARWLRSGLFQSQDDIARALKISPAQVSRVLKLAQLPTVIVEAFDNPTEIRENWGRTLLARLEDPRTRPALIETARSLIAKPERRPVKEVYRQLLAAAAKGRKIKPRHHDVVVRAESGTTLFRIRHQRDSVALLLPLESVAERTLRDISDAVAGILQAASVQAADSMANTRSKPKGNHVSRRPRKPENADGVVHPTPL